MVKSPGGAQRRRRCSPDTSRGQPGTPGSTGNEAARGCWFFRANVAGGRLTTLTLPFLGGPFFVISCSERRHAQKRREPPSWVRATLGQIAPNHYYDTIHSTVFGRFHCILNSSHLRLRMRAERDIGLAPLSRPLSRPQVGREDCPPMRRAPWFSIFQVHTQYLPRSRGLTRLVCSLSEMPKLRKPHRRRRPEKRRHGRKLSWCLTRVGVGLAGP